MTNTTKEVFEKYQVRKTKKQKTAFIEYTKQVAEKYGYNVNIEKGSFGSRNIVVGNPKNAKVIYTAHYDTCARLPLPNFITPKNMFVYILFQLLIVAFYFAIVFGVRLLTDFALSSIDMNEILRDELTRWIPLSTLIIILLLMMVGPANKHTANDNTSGVTTLLDIMTNMPDDQKDKVAFIFFDLEETGIIGSSSFASNHKDVKKNSLVINFDCVSDGDTIFFALKKTTKKYADILQKAFVSDNNITVDISSGAFYPSDNTSFKGGIGVCALKKSKTFGTLYMNRIHTNRDIIYREENIEFLKNGAIKLAQIL
ncbi:MAG: M28 family peptidase [Eubacteriales bacterium]|nr:M28 family peptidase [Eubacteriales bacterium]